MTREEALKIAGYDLGILKLINVIYDDFESRTCGNCISWDGVGYCSLIEWECVETFGCNQFERRNDE